MAAERVEVAVGEVVAAGKEGALEVLQVLRARVPAAEEQAASRSPALREAGVERFPRTVQAAASLSLSPLGSCLLAEHKEAVPAIRCLVLSKFPS